MIQVYTGKGKGKTTASLGMALRAAGAGFKVYIGQFIKCGRFSEVKALKKFRNIKLEQFGCGFIKGRPGPKDILLAKKGLAKVSKAIKKKKYDVVILDEINPALKKGLLRLEDVLRLIKTTPKKIELVFTGRDCPRQLRAAADLVSRIVEEKHYFHQGQKARRGIEF